MNGAKGGLKSFLIDVVRGCAIGVAFIIPGFSGGSVAAILGIYEKLVGAIADIFKDFKKSILTLLPILIGMVCGIVALLFPLEWALGAYPIPTVCIFVGLALGGLPSITDKLGGKIKVTNIFHPASITLHNMKQPLSQLPKSCMWISPNHIILPAII